MDYATKHSPPLLLLGCYQLVCRNCGRMQQSTHLQEGCQKRRNRHSTDFEWLTIGQTPRHLFVVCSSFVSRSFVVCSSFVHHSFVVRSSFVRPPHLPWLIVMYHFILVPSRLFVHSRKSSTRFSCAADAVILCCLRFGGCFLGRCGDKTGLDISTVNGDIDDTI